MGNTSCCCSCFSFQSENENLISSMSLAFDDITQIDAFISYIDQLLEAIGKARNVDKPDPDRVDSSIKSGGDLLEKVLKHANGHACINCKKVTMPKLDRETRKLAIDISKEGAQIKWLGVALSVVAFVLDRFDQISSNQKQCEELVKDLCKLAKNVKRLDKHLGEEMNEVLRFIVEGSLMCVSLMKSHGISRFFAAPVDAEDLQSFRSKLGHKYSELTLEATTTLLDRVPADMSNALEATATLLDRIPGVVPPSQGEPSQAVGIEGAKNQVIKLLDTENKSRRIVVIYGQGGIGKTTLATAVFNSLNLNNYKYCRVDMEQNCLERDLKLLQEKMLRDLFSKNVVLTSWVEGQQELSKAFKEAAARRVFLFVDNALKGSDLQKLLPDNALLPAESKILLTTRNLDETNIIRLAEIMRFSYKVDSLPQSEAAKVLCEYALGSRDATFHHTMRRDIEGLLQICSGIPLVLRMAGCELREHVESVAACKEVVESVIEDLRQGGGDSELSERMVDFVYNRLHHSSQQAFLDIVFFFYDSERDRVAYTFGETEVLKLERAALVNVTKEGKLSVHDIVKARGRMLSDGHRIIDEETLADVVQDLQKIQNTKGILLSYSSQYKLEAKHLNSMRRSLRVLRLGKDSLSGPSIVNGECKGTFENLRFLELDYHNYSKMDLNKLPKLAVFIGRFHWGEKFCEFSGGVSSLKEIYLSNADSKNLTMTTRCQHKSLRSLTIWRCERFTSIDETFGNLSALERLHICNCTSLVSLPDSFGSLSALSELNLSMCRYLEGLPDSFGNLFSLKRLDMTGCDKLSCLPQNFGQLKSLEYMSIRECKGLRSLSSDFGCLTSLKAINASYCSQLEEKAMDSLAEMKTLMFANIRESHELIKRWEQVLKHQYSLAVASWEGFIAMGDIRNRTFFYRESRLVGVDDDGKLEECSFPEGGVKVALLLSMCNLISPANGRNLETLKKKCVGLASSAMIIYVDMVQEGLWEERERRVRHTLPHLPRGTRAWIGADNRTTQLFAFSIYRGCYWFEKVVHSFIALASTCSVNEEKEGSRGLEDLEGVFPNKRDNEEATGGYELGGTGDFPTLFATLQKANDFVHSRSFYS